MQQTLLPKQELRYVKRYTHGGLSLKKRRKIKRPLIPGAVTHLVLKSSKARGRYCLLRNKRIVTALLKERADRFYIEVLDFVNMGNHLHLKVRFKDVKFFQNFLRTFSGLLARRITNSHKGRRFGTKFWDGLAFTRVLRSKIEEFGLKGYFEANREQARKGYAARQAYLLKFNRFMYRLRQTRAAPIVV